MKKIYPFLLLLIFLSCQEDKKLKSDKDALQFAENIAKTHRADAFQKEDVITYHIDVSFNEMQSLNATITHFIGTQKRIIKKDGGTTLYHDGNETYIHPSNAVTRDATLDAQFWTYLFLLPQFTQEPGTVWQGLEKKPLTKQALSTAKLLYQPTTAPTQNDWFQVYIAADTKLVKAAAFSKPLGSKSTQKQAVVYENYVTIGEVPLPNYWKFFHWSPEQGISKKPIGEALIKNIQFQQKKDVKFSIPKDAKKIDR